MVHRLFIHKCLLKDFHGLCRQHHRSLRCLRPPLVTYQAPLLRPRCPHTATSATRSQHCLCLIVHLYSALKLASFFRVLAPAIRLDHWHVSFALMGVVALSFVVGPIRPPLVVDVTQGRFFNEPKQATLVCLCLRTLVHPKCHIGSLPAGSRGSLFPQCPCSCCFW